MNRHNFAGKIEEGINLDTEHTNPAIRRIMQMINIDELIYDHLPEPSKSHVNLAKKRLKASFVRFHG